MTTTPTTHGTAPTPSQTPGAPAEQEAGAMLRPTDSRIIFVQQLAAVAVELAGARIATKEAGSGNNRYDYATAAGITAAVIPALARRGIIIFPRTLSAGASLEPLTGDKKIGWIGSVEMEFIITNGAESELLPARAVGVAWDGASQAIAKAQTIAYREILKKLFGIVAAEDETEPGAAGSRTRTASQAAGQAAPRPAPSAGSQPAAAPAPAEHRQSASAAAEERAAAIAAAQAAADATGATLPALIERWSIASARRQTARKVESLSNAELLIVAGWGAANPLAAAGAG